MAWELDRRFNFFFSLPAQLNVFAVTFITEMSLNVMLKFT